jgi:hypothetical protein
MRILVLLFITQWLFSCQPCPPVEQAPDVGPPPYVLTEAGKDSIMVAIDVESQAFYERQLEGWAKSYASSEDVFWTCVEEKGLVLEAYTWNDLYKLVSDYFQVNPDPTLVDIRRENVRFKGDGELVWVSFDEYQIIDSKTKLLKGVRLMKRIEGMWKIACLHSSFQKHI